MQDTLAPSGTQDGASSAAADGGVQTRTDWERFEFSVALEFVDRSKVRMSLGGDQEVVEGEWRVVESAGNRLTIQIVTENDPRGANDQAPTSSSPLVRQFVIRFEGEEADRFTLVEDGADPDLGSLLFERVP